MIGRLSPFFCYYGGKWRAAPKYPTPKHGTIIEPFAGGAGYSLNYPERQVILYDLDPTICEIWDYLIHVSEKEILALPSRVDHVDDVDAPKAARSLIGFWLNKGSVSPRKTPSKWARSGIRPNSFWGQTIKERIAFQLHAIRHWQIKNDSYEIADNQTATWFVDPPYQLAGKLYRVGFSDFEGLATWCKSREGQVIVCEQEGATWLPFEPFRIIKSTPGAHGKSFSAECIWVQDTEV